MHRNESAASFVSAASLSASESQEPGISGPGTPLKASLTRQLSELEKREDEDLYRWMARQQVGCSLNGSIPAVIEKKERNRNTFNYEMEY